jgi:hypothetical protein
MSTWNTNYDLGAEMRKKRERLEAVAQSQKSALGIFLRISRWFYFILFIETERRLVFAGVGCWTVQCTLKPSPDQVRRVWYRQRKDRSRWSMADSLINISAGTEQAATRRGLLQPNAPLIRCSILLHLWTTVEQFEYSSDNTLRLWNLTSN